MTTTQLTESGAVTLDSTGSGVVQLGVQSARETWNPSSLSVSCNSNILESACSIYVGSRPGDSQNFRGRTVSGSSGDSSSISDTISIGIYIWAVWVGGDPGATATLTVVGSRDI